MPAETHAAVRTLAAKTNYTTAITKGVGVIDTPDMLRLKAGFGFGAGASRGNVLLHELGHVVGLTT